MFVCTGVPDFPAEEDRCSFGAPECRAGGQESVCQRGTWPHFVAKSTFVKRASGLRLLKILKLHEVDVKLKLKYK